MNFAACVARFFFKKTSDEQLILKAITLQNQSVSYLQSANGKTTQNKSKKKKILISYLGQPSQK